MKIVEKENFNILQAQKGKMLKDKEQNDEEVYLCKEAYIPKSLTIEKCKEKFVEVEEDT